MPFCTECGEELPPGSKFCESCGTPVGQQPASPLPTVPADHPLPSDGTAPGPKKGPAVPKQGIIAAAVVVLVVVAAGLWFFGLPALEKASGAAKTVPVSQETPVPVLSTPVMIETTPAPVPAATGPIRKLEGKYENYYDEVYSHSQFYAFGQKEFFSYTLEKPPLYIKYNLTPVLKTRQKIVDIGMSSERTINVTYPNPNAWFEISVLDADNGAVIETRGFGKDYPDVTKSEFMVRNKGKYTVVFSGNDVTADISILQGTT